MPKVQMKSCSRRTFPAYTYLPIYDQELSALGALPFDLARRRKHTDAHTHKAGAEAGETGLGRAA